MRYIGNKTKLLAEIEEVLRVRGVTGGTLIDIFTGSASVARHFKQRGFRVYANDLLSVSYTQAVAALEVTQPPQFAGVFHRLKAEFRSASFREAFIESLEGSYDADAVNAYLDDGRLTRASLLPLALMVFYLNNRVEPSEGLIFRNFCPGGSCERMYFRDDHGRRIDGVLDFLKTHHDSGLLGKSDLHLLLSALINAADKRANISGTYGAYLKRWQSNTEGDLTLVIPEVSSSRTKGHRVFQEDSNDLIRKLRGDVLYIDPPYNRRQYAANYHVLDIIALHHKIGDVEMFEQSLYGKTGLRPYGDSYSDYCIPAAGRIRRPRGMSPGRSTSNVQEAFKKLVLSANVDHIVVSYNEEGLLDREELGAILAQFSGIKRYNFSRDFKEIQYRRFRSDRDRGGNDDGPTRRYAVVEGKDKNVVGEWLFYARRGGS